MRLEISSGEDRRRISKVREEMKNRALDLLLLTNDKTIFYLSGFTHITTERPAIMVVPPEGDLAFLGPLLEADHLKHQTNIVGEVKTYLDYPGIRHPIDLFADWLREMGCGKSRIGTDNPAGATGAYGYTGPTLPEKLPDASFVRAGEIVWSMRLIKSDEEIELIRENAKWGNLAHQFLQKYTVPGIWDTDISLMASSEASAIMKKTLGPEYEQIRSGQVTSFCRLPWTGWLEVGDTALHKRRQIDPVGRCIGNGRRSRRRRI